MTVALLSGADMADCLDGGRGCFNELAATMFDEVPAFGEGSAMTCIGREGKMLRVSACAREEVLTRPFQEKTPCTIGARGNVKLPNRKYGFTLILRKRERVEMSLDGNKER